MWRATTPAHNQRAPPNMHPCSSVDLWRLLLDKGVDGRDVARVDLLELGAVLPQARELTAERRRRRGRVRRVQERMWGVRARRCVAGGAPST